MIQLLSADRWKDYELLDSGDGEKLERFGAYVLWRPEPQAVWNRRRDETQWRKEAHARFVQTGSHEGNWERFKPIQDQWFVGYTYKKMRLQFRLGMTAFKHVGIFPEQAVNWEYIYDSTLSIPNAKVLNLFAYTGGASLAARAAGADVIHCDAIRSVVSWANANMQASNLNDIRWLVEDAFKFVKREARRENTFHGIILDPPAYGHGPKGEKWQLQDMVNELISEVASILDKEQYFLVLNSYSLGFSSLILENLLQTHFPKAQLKQLEYGELCLPAADKSKLPMGIFARFRHG